MPELDVIEGSAPEMGGAEGGQPDFESMTVEQLEKVVPEQGEAPKPEAVAAPSTEGKQAEQKATEKDPNASPEEVGKNLQAAAKAAEAEAKNAVEDLERNLRH